MAIPAAVEQVQERLVQTWVTVRPYAKTALHYLYIPAIIGAGMMFTDPKPSWVQLLGPM